MLNVLPYSLTSNSAEYSCCLLFWNLPTTFHTPLLQIYQNTPTHSILSVLLWICCLVVIRVTQNLGIMICPPHYFRENVKSRVYSWIQRDTVHLYNNIIRGLLKHEPHTIFEENQLSNDLKQKFCIYVRKFNFLKWLCIDEKKTSNWI